MVGWMIPQVKCLLHKYSNSSLDAKPRKKQKSHSFTIPMSGKQYQEETHEFLTSLPEQALNLKPCGMLS